MKQMENVNFKPSKILLSDENEEVMELNVKSVEFHNSTLETNTELEMYEFPIKSGNIANMNFHYNSNYYIKKDKKGEMWLIQKPYKIIFDSEFKGDRYE